MEFQDKIRLLLRENYEAHSSMDVEEKARLCQNMIRFLQSQTHRMSSSDGNDSQDDEDEDNQFLKTRRNEKPSATAETLAAAPNLRSVLGNLSLDEISQFSNLLASGITDRLDNEELLPATQDEVANFEAMDGPTAQKLPRRALQTALLYVHLLKRPGSWGAGFVQSSALTALTALLKRWRVEIQDFVVKKANKKNSDAPGSTSGNLRRSRAKPGAIAESDSSDDDDDAMEVDREGEREHGFSSTLSHQELLMLGLNLCHEVAHLPLHSEFLSWSSECREAVVEAVFSALGTSSALTAPSRRSSIDTAAMLLAEKTARLTKESLSDCLVVADLEEDGDGVELKGSMMSKLHETVVCICRGLFQILSWREALPLGEAGKQAAAMAASTVLENLIEGLSGNVTMYQLARSPLKGIEIMSNTGDNMMSPDRKISAHSHVTPKSRGRRGRLSTPNAKKIPTMTSPKLKSTARRAVSMTTAKSKNVPIFSALLGLMQKIATDVAMEKATVRNSAVTTIHKCTGSLRFRERRHFLQFLIQMCHSRVPVHRLLGCEIVGKILSEVWLWTEHAGQLLQCVGDSIRSRKSLTPLVDASERDMPSALFGALHGRLTDRVPTVRWASIASLSGLLKTVRESNASESGASVSAMGLSETLSTEAIELLDALRGRATDDPKATVRRYAVMALGEVFKWSASELTEHDLALLRDRCEDSSMMTRKAAAEALTSLVEMKEPCDLDESILDTWISAVLPLCLDSDGGCANACLEFVQRLAIRPLAMNEEIESELRVVNKAWSILSKVGDGSGRQGASRNESEAIKAAIVALLENAADPGRTKLDLINLIRRVATETLVESDGLDEATDARRTGIWCLFDAFVRSFKDNSALLQLFRRKSVDVSFVSMAWYHLLGLSTKAHFDALTSQRLLVCSRKALYVMAVASRALDETEVRDAHDRLQQMLSSFELPEDLIGSAVAALTSATLALSPLGDVEAAQKHCKGWILEVYDSCESLLGGIVGSQASAGDMVRVSRGLYAIGECSLVGFSPSDDGNSSKREAASLSAKDFHAKGMLGMYVKPTTTLVDLVLSFLSKNLAGTSSVELPENVRAFAFLALGKLCLRDVDLARRTLTMLARELHENMSKGSSVIQCNVLLIMGDLCIKYTSLADRYLPVMAVCLQSGIVDITRDVFGASSDGGFEIVRKSAVILLTSLIMQDYIKWRGLLFHRFLVAATDENEEVAHLAENTLSGPLLVKTPKLFFNNFVESFFVLNRCSAHPMYIAAASNGDGGSGIAVGFDGIDLSGETGRLRRLKMYDLMLSRMTDDEKITVTAKIAREVLKGALVEGSDLHKACSKSSGRETASSAYLVLSDALTVLRSQKIRVGKKASNDTEDIEDPNMDETSKKRITEATNRLMSKISRKQLTEIIVPILGNLKTLLQQNCSPLLGDLRPYLVELYLSAKTEVEEVLANDPTLLQEIQYDARQLKKASSIPTEMRMSTGGGLPVSTRK